jgi:phosphoserine phosphatase
MISVPPTGEARAILVEEKARQAGLSAEHVVAYADSSSDLPMLEVSGFPVAVNPEAKLATIARRRGWLIEHWERPRGGPRRLLALSTTPRDLGRAPAIESA